MNINRDAKRRRPDPAGSFSAESPPAGMAEGSPVCRTMPTGERTPMPPAEDADSRPVIFVIDDDSTVRRLVVRMVQKAFPRCEVVSAQDGLEAAGLLESICPVAIVLDLQMPRMDGATLCQRLTADGTFDGSMIIVCTGRADPEMLQRIQQAGVRTLLPKPFAMADLVHEVGLRIERAARVDRVRQALGNEAAKPDSPTGKRRTP